MVEVEVEGAEVEVEGCSLGLKGGVEVYGV